jgi:acetate kinase
VDDLARLAPLAPLHQSHNLAPIRTILNVAPQIPQVACFDTAFHRSQSYLAQAFALPRQFSDAGVRRYGFHGLSYEFLVSRLRELAPDLASGRVVIAHLGNGASMCAVKDGRSVAAIEDLIYRQSGLLGVSGVSSDMRALRASSDPAAGEAIALFVYRIVRELGSLVAALGGVDALVFSGGIGEHDAMIRGRRERFPMDRRRPRPGSQFPWRTPDQRRRLGRFSLGRPDRRGAAHRAPYSGGSVVKTPARGCFASARPS